MKTKMLVRCALVAAFGSFFASAPTFAAQGHWTPIAWGNCWMAPYFNGNSCQFNYQGSLWQIDYVTLANKTPWRPLWVLWGMGYTRSVGTPHFPNALLGLRQSNL